MIAAEHISEWPASIDPEGVIVVDQAIPQCQLGLGVMQFSIPVKETFTSQRSGKYVNTGSSSSSGDGKHVNTGSSSISGDGTACQKRQLALKSGDEQKKDTQKLKVLRREDIRLCRQ